MGGVDLLTWYALGLTLTLLGLVWAWVTYRKRGLAAALVVAGWALVPLALALTRLLRLVAEFAYAVNRWVAWFVWSPTVWLGFVLLLLSASLIVVGRRAARSPAKPHPTPSAGNAAAAEPSHPPTKRAAATSPDVDDEITAILKKHGIQ